MKTEKSCDQNGQTEK